MDWEKRIVIDPAILVGKPVIKEQAPVGRIHHRPAGTGMD